MTTFTMTINDDQGKLIQQYLEQHGLDFSDFASQTILKRLEDEDDIASADKAYSDYLENPVTYTLAEMRERYAL